MLGLAESSDRLEHSLLAAVVAMPPTMPPIMPIVMGFSTVPVVRRREVGLGRPISVKLFGS